LLKFGNRHSHIRLSYKTVIRLVIVARLSYDYRKMFFGIGLLSALPVCCTHGIRHDAVCPSVRLSHSRVVSKSSPSRILTKGRVLRPGGFFTGTMQVTSTSIGAWQPAAAVSLSCRYWGLNDSFCCVHRDRYSQCFSVGRTTPNCPFLWIHGSLGPHESALQTASRSIQLFLHSSSVCPTRTDRHTNHATCDICSTRTHQKMR